MMVLPPDNGAEMIEFVDATDETDEGITQDQLLSEMKDGVRDMLLQVCRTMEVAEAATRLLERMPRA
jgi:hypothetical protein